MEPHDFYLLHSARNLAASFDREKKTAAAQVVTDLANRLEPLLKNEPGETIAIEREVFRQLFETSGLFMFLVDNIGRLSLHSEPNTGKFEFRMNPPGRRQQFLRQDVIQALMDIREKLKAPQYG